MNETTHIDPTAHPATATSSASTSARLRLGKLGEQLAAEHLTEQGFTLLGRNWRTRQGELDIIASEQETLVAVEVKTRSGMGYGSPLEAITAIKARRLRLLLLEWRRLHAPRAHRLRIDAIGVLMLPGAPPRLDHLRGIS